MDTLECRLTVAPFLLYRFSVNVMHDHPWDQLGTSGIIGYQSILVKNEFGHVASRAILVLAIGIALAFGYLYLGRFPPRNARPSFVQAVL